MCTGVCIASSPGLFEKSEKRAWYLLFTNALNLPSFWKFWIILFIFMYRDVDMATLKRSNGAQTLASMNHFSCEKSGCLWVLAKL